MLRFFRRPFSVLPFRPIVLVDSELKDTWLLCLGGRETNTANLVESQSLVNVVYRIEFMNNLIFVKLKIYDSN